MVTTAKRPRKTRSGFCQHCGRLDPVVIRCATCGNDAGPYGVHTNGECSVCFNRTLDQIERGERFYLDPIAEARRLDEMADLIEHRTLVETYGNPEHVLGIA